MKISNSVSLWQNFFWQDEDKVHTIKIEPLNTQFFTIDEFMNSKSVWPRARARAAAVKGRSPKIVVHLLSDFLDVTHDDGRRLEF